MFGVVLWIVLVLATLAGASPTGQTVLSKDDNRIASPIGSGQDKIAPRVFIVSMFEPEETAWTSRVDFVHEHALVGLSPTYPCVRCVRDYSVCQFTTGEGEINAAASVAFLVASPLFDLSLTYWLLAGIAGGEPSQVTTGSATFARYAVQVGLQYQIDPSEISNSNWSTGYFSYGTKNPWTYPDSVYGTEVFELNATLRDRALQLAQSATLQLGDDANVKLRHLYPEPASLPPSVVACDVLTSDGYFTGEVLSSFFANYTKMITNGTATYCATAQEENASLEAFIRVAKSGVIDFSRIVVMRTISNFVRAPPSLAHRPLDFFLDYPKGGFQHAIDNLYIAGWPFVHDVVANWDTVYAAGTHSAQNYIGDIVNSLGGTPDFGKDQYNIR